MSQAGTVALKIATGIVLLIIGILLLAGCQPMLDTAQALAGRRAVTHTDANGITVVVTPATPGLIPPVAESLAAVAAAIGMPILALWIRAIGKAAQNTADTIAENPDPAPKTPPHSPA